MFGGRRGGGEVHADIVNFDAHGRERKGRRPYSLRTAEGRREEKKKYEEGEVLLFLLHHCRGIHVQLHTCVFSSLSFFLDEIITSFFFLSTFPRGRTGSSFTARSDSCVVIFTSKHANYLL